jgi:hypothetical protein
MRRSLLAALAATLIVAFLPGPTASAGFGYRDHGTDPDDVEPFEYVVDLRGTTRKVWQDDRGHRWLSITIWGHHRLGSTWEVLASIDGRGGPLRESRLYFIGFRNDRRCEWFNGQEGETFSIFVDGRRATCRIPLRLIDPNKRIRWRLRSPFPATYGNTVDHAPDVGWYV